MTGMERFWNRNGLCVTKEEYWNKISEEITPTWADSKIPSLEIAQTVIRSENNPRSLRVAIAQEEEFISDHDYQEIFFNHYGKTNNLAYAAALIGVTAEAVREKRKKDKLFDRMCLQCEDMYADRVKSIFQELALNGTTKETYDRNGSLISTEQVMYPRLLELEIKRVDNAYNEKREVAHTVNGGVLVAPASVTVDEWSKKYSEDGGSYSTRQDEDFSTSGLVDITPIKK